ncbi:hypothetical protein P67b_00089 [Ruegeria phage Tedan]|nr:hypothetical protein P67b_00089 [Ruegeria phage Tedan]
MVQTVRPLATLFNLLGDNAAGDISAQDLRDAIISLWQNTVPLWTDVDHENEQVVRRVENGVTNLYQANDAIPAGTGFTVGDTGATWTLFLDGSGGTSHLTANRIPMVQTPGERLIDSGIRMLANGELLMPGDTGFEADSLRLGDVTTLHEANSFIRLSNQQFPTTRFDLIDARSRPDGESSRPRQFFLSEAENTFEFNVDDGTQITVNPLTMNYTATLDSQTNSFTFRTFAAMTNVRITVSYTLGNQTVIKYLPSKAVVLDGTGGIDFGSGDNTINFPDSPFRQFVGDQVTVLVEADSVSFLGAANNFPYLTAELQRGEFRDLAYLSDLQAANPVSVTAFDIPAVLDKTPDAPFTLSGTQTFTYAFENGINIQTVEILQGASVLGTLTDQQVFDGTVDLAINAINLAAAGDSAVFTLRATAADGEIASRNLTIRVPQPQEFVYVWHQNTALIPPAVPGNALRTEFAAGTQRLTIPTFADDEHIVYAQPTAEPQPRQILIGGLNQIAAFTNQSALILIGGVSYDLWISNNSLIGSAVSGAEITIVR